VASGGAKRKREGAGCDTVCHACIS